MVNKVVCKEDHMYRIDEGEIFSVNYKREHLTFNGVYEILDYDACDDGCFYLIKNDLGYEEW